MQNEDNPTELESGQGPGPDVFHSVGHDPWAYRSAGMRCTNCMWFVEKQSEKIRVDKLGRCRRRCPTMNGYPAVYESDWCGDFKLKE